MHLARVDAAREMHRAKILGMLEPSRGGQLGQRMQHRAVEIADALGLVLDDERARAGRVLRRDAGRAAVGVAAQRLDAAEREHEAARGIAPVGAERQGAPPCRRR